MVSIFHNNAGIAAPVLLFSIVLNALTLVLPLYMHQIYDRALVSRSTDTLVLLSVIAVAALAVFDILEAVRGVRRVLLAAGFCEAAVGVIVSDAFVSAIRQSIESDGCHAQMQAALVEFE